MPKAPINGIELYYEVHGEGPVIVFAHGAGGNHMSWWQQVPVFQRDYRCVTFDHRGFGQSHDLPDGPGRNAYVADLVALLDHLGAAECFLVAQSMGGLTGFGLALAQPHRVKALVMADTVVGIPSQALFAERRRLVEQGTAATGHAYHPSLWQRDPAKAVLYEQIRALNPPQESNEERRRRALLEAATEDGDLRSFSVPTFFLFGAEDSQIPASLGRMAQQIVPGSRYVEVAGCGHSVYFERPEEFNRIVAGFFAEVGA
ncbi:MAG: alpha/beta fold hydrolase [Chloroflexi bacterium]|nr:alpha/beta fold hydrolase [Chloroflexota bacterium]